MKPQLSAIEQIDLIIGQIKANIERPGSRPVTSTELKNRADRRRHMATAILMQDGQVKPEYQPMGDQ
jgi:hypothetical protein